MASSLLGSAEAVAAHDALGKVRMPLQRGVRGDAVFSVCGRYRHMLCRDWGEPSDPYMLVVGMNPSTALADVDDPTIRKCIHFTRQMGLTSLVMCNAMDYRATDPKALLRVQPRSNVNLEYIEDLAKGADRVVLAWGALPRKLRVYGDDVISILRAYNLFCFGKTKHGFPRHPLYLANDAPIVPFNEEA